MPFFINRGITTLVAPGGPLLLDASAHGPNNSTGTTTATLTTTVANTVIVATILVNAFGDPDITMSDNSGVTAAWTYRGRSGSGASSHIEFHWTTATAAFTGKTFTATGPGVFTVLDVYAISGANISSPFDGSLVTGTVDPVSVITTVNDTIVVGGMRFGSTGSPTQGAGFALISGAGNTLAEYKVLSSTQTLSFTAGTGAGDANGVVAQAIK